MKKRNLSWVLVLVLCCCVTAQAETCWEEHDGITFFEESGKIGWYCEKEYKQNAVFDAVLPFVGEWAVIRQGEYWGMADRTGNYAIAPIWSGIRLSRQFAEDHLVFCYNESMAQIIKLPEGNVIYRGDPSEIFYGAEGGIVLVSMQGNAWRAVDMLGQVLFELEADALYACGNNYYNVCLPDGENALLDTSGRIFPNSVSQFCSAIDENRAVKWDTEKSSDGIWTKRVCLLDEAGNILQAYENIQEVHAWLENHWWHVCSDSRIAVKVDDLWGYLNENGKMVIEPAWEEAQAFSCGLAAVKKSGKWGYIDREGNTVVPFQFDEAVPYVENVARVWIDDGAAMICRFIDLEGNFIGSVYDFADDYCMGTASVLKDDEAFMVDENGRRLWNEKRPYTTIYRYGDEYPGLWVAYDEEKEQDYFLDEHGKVLCPFEPWEDDTDYETL